MKVCVVTIVSDSGDAYAPLVFKKRPTRAQLCPLLEKHTGEEPGPLDAYDPGFPGNYGYLHVEFHEVEVRE